MMDKNNITKNLKTEKSDTTLKEATNQIKVLNIDNIDGSTFQTKKKSFISEINPHLIRRNIQKEQYIWFGVFDDLLRNKCMLKAIKKCKDTSLPLVNIFLL
jgi:cephalosporin-C deacetylase-like acetyl esterase